VADGRGVRVAAGVSVGGGAVLGKGTLIVVPATSWVVITTMQLAAAICSEVTP
jgi:hypothetical protein